MKAVIMAGGEGTRLRPLTCDSPKPMAHLCGRPVLEYILDLLQEHDVLDAAVTMRYIPSAITAHFGDGYRQMRLSFSEEDKPLGTAGSVRLAVDSQWGGADDDVLIISGDALTDIDLSEACAFHKSRHAAATLIVTRVADPREYGLAEFDREGRITGFLEKPGWGQAATDAANTGIYILSPEALESIPADTNFDFAKDLFPLLLRDGLPLYAYETKDYWCDIGDLTTYLTCQRDILEGRVKTNLPVKDGVCMAEEPAGGYTLIPPIYIGKNVQIGAAAQIGPFAVLGDGCHIGNNAKVRGSVLLDGVYIGDRAALTGALVCHGASVRRGEEKHIFPYQENADIMLNSSLFYEISVLRPFAEKILREVPDTVPEYDEARRMLKFLDNFIPIAPDEVPPTSILREFIGGSSFQY